MQHVNPNRLRLLLLSQSSANACSIVELLNTHAANVGQACMLRSHQATHQLFGNTRLDAEQYHLITQQETVAGGGH